MKLNKAMGPLVLTAALMVMGAPTQAQTKAAAAPPASQYVTVKIEDLKVDLKQMVGKKVAVGALAESMGEMLFLKASEFDTNSIEADFERLPREDRKKIANDCQMNSCRGTFYGTVRNLSLGVGVVLDKVQWR